MADKKLSVAKHNWLKVLVSPHFSLLALAFILFSASVVELSKLAPANNQAPQLSVTSSSNSVQPTPNPSVTKPKSATKPKTSSQTKHHVVATAPAKPLPRPTHVVVPSPKSHAHGLKPKSKPSGTGGSGSGSSTPPTTVSYTSTNWSGYLTANGSYTTVSGSWAVPSPTGNASSTSADSSWIGIGGVTSGDLIQVGTQNTVSRSGRVSSGAFYEMLPAVSQPIPGLTVSPEDLMSASVIETASNQWTISITDETSSQTFTDNVSYASTNSSAEWIEEDPSFSSGGLVPFDDFGTVSFSGGSTTVNGNSESILGAGGESIAMVDSGGNTIAQPSAIGSDGASFSVTRK